MNAIFLLIGFLLAAIGCGGSAKKAGSGDTLSDYVRQARSLPRDDRRAEGSLWSETSTLAGGFRDLRASRLADIVTIQVLEETSALAEASTESSKSENLDSKFPNLYGLEKGVSELPNLLGGSRTREFSGEGSTTRRSVLRTSIAARVVEVFPNASLLLEGNREIEINDEKQMVIVRGVARPQDISPNNAILSTKLAELEIQVLGRGTVSEAQKPGVLYRVLSGVWPF